MRDIHKTKQQIINELEEKRQPPAEFRMLEAVGKQAEEALQKTHDGARNAG